METDGKLLVWGNYAAPGGRVSLTTIHARPSPITLLVSSDRDQERGRKHDE